VRNERGAYRHRVDFPRDGAILWRLRIAIIFRSSPRKQKPLLITIDEKGSVRTFPLLIFPRSLDRFGSAERSFGAGVGTPP
jgi:hypothetical protein